MKRHEVPPPLLINLWRRQSAWMRHRPRVVAYHEIGHALVAHNLGMPFEKVSLVGDWEKAGYIAGVAPPRGDPPCPTETEAYVTLLLGGMAVHKVITGFEDWSWGATLPDQFRAQRWLLRVYPDAGDRAACRARARRRAHVIAVHALPAIGPLADVLCTLGELSSGDFRRIVRECLGGSRPSASAAVAQQVAAMEMNWSLP